MLLPKVIKVIKLMTVSFRWCNTIYEALLSEKERNRKRKGILM